VQEDLKKWLEIFFLSNHNSQDYSFKRFNKNLSIIYEIEIDNTYYFLKAQKYNNPFLQNESVILPILSNIFSDIVNKPIHLCENNNWFLSKKIWGTSGNSLTLSETIKIFKKIKKIYDFHHLENYDLPVRDKNYLLYNLELINKNNLFFNKILFDKIKYFISTVNSKISIIHGDLNLNNIIVNESNVTILDWTDCCLSYREVDLYILLFLNKNEKSIFLEELFNRRFTDNDITKIELLINLYYFVSYYTLNQFCNNSYFKDFLFFKNNIINIFSCNNSKFLYK
jgi:hypothetical protein